MMLFFFLFFFPFLVCRQQSTRTTGRHLILSAFSVCARQREKLQRVSALAAALWKIGGLRGNLTKRQSRSVGGRRCLPHVPIFSFRTRSSSTRLCTTSFTDCEMTPSWAPASQAPSAARFERWTDMSITADEEWYMTPSKAARVVNHDVAARAAHLLPGSYQEKVLGLEDLQHLVALFFQGQPFASSRLQQTAAAQDD